LSIGNGLCGNRRGIIVDRDVDKTLGGGGGDEALAEDTVAVIGAEEGSEEDIVDASLSVDDQGGGESRRSSYNQSSEWCEERNDIELAVLAKRKSEEPLSLGLETARWCGQTGCLNSASPAPNKMALPEIALSVALSAATPETSPVLRCQAAVRK
jgi:hypothetical protein